MEYTVLYRCKTSANTTARHKGGSLAYIDRFDLSFMKRLIILRGPMGSGKNSVSTSLIELVGKDNACILDLDIIHPQEDKFNQNLKECLRYNTVIGMMFYGNSHTTAPAHWLGEFRNHDYRILSVILYASKELCFERCKNDPGRPSVNKQKVVVYKNHYDFYRRECETPFHKAANLEEIKIDTNPCRTEIAKNILKRFSDEMTNTSKRRV